MKDATLLNIAKRIQPLLSPASVTRMPWEEGNGYSSAWKITDGQGTYLLKAASPNELAIYRRLNNLSDALPRFYGTATYYKKDYILLEFIAGHNLMRCTRQDLVRVLDAMIALQDAYWGTSKEIGESAAAVLQSCQKRRAFLPESDWLAVFDQFLDAYLTLPRTLCHNDLLPFNLIVSDARTVFIDWEAGGILPYPCMLVRLLAHGSEQGETPFYMTKADKAFAIQYYYAHLIQGKGIPYAAYRQALELFWFFELTEWIYVYRKYRRPPDALYDHYLHQLQAGLPTRSFF